MRQRLRELAAERPRFGYRRLHVLLRREGVIINHKRVERLYREEGLAVRRRRRKRVARDGRGRAAAARTTQPAVGRRLRERCPGLGPADPALHGRGCLHAGSAGHRGRYLAARRTGGAGAGAVGRSSAAPRTRSSWTTARSWRARPSISGPTSAGCGCASSSQESRSRTPSSRAFRDDCATNASTAIGSLA